MARSSNGNADPLRRWTIKDARETYGVREWGRDYFSINDAGNLQVSHGAASVDLKVLVDDLVRRGIQLPLLIRFTDLLEARIRLLNEAFASAIAEYGYQGQYRGVYPIKVNQARKVVEAITRFGRPYHYGLEAGSKPELLAATAMLDDGDALLICNGYKDKHYIETALLASTLGRRVIIVVEKPSELKLIHAVATELGVEAAIGIRMRLSTRGSGKWEKSGGDGAKFGLSAEQILSAINDLRSWGALDSLQLLHFHLGSQITSIRTVKDALHEATRMYTELVKLGCTNLLHVDVGGGLGVDYDGSQTNFDSSMNYSVQEYANDVVWSLFDACENESLPHPTVVTEAGRAVVAHHTALVVNVIGVAGRSDVDEVDEPGDDDDDVAHELWEVYSSVNRRNVREMYHDALEYKDRVLQLFNLGQLSLPQRAKCERLFWAACYRMAEIAPTLPRMPKELKNLESMLADTYFCNFSMFQSLPDSWAIDQLFPIMPIHRLQERPTHRAVLGDITCDSDGKIDSFIHSRDVKETLELHSYDGSPYYLAMMLTGAYQEILGDLHNLFGDTNVVHVVLSEDRGYEIDEVIPGDTVTDVLRYVDYTPAELVKLLRASIEGAVRREVMSLDEAKQLMRRFQEGLAAYTYLE